MEVLKAKSRSIEKIFVTRDAKGEILDEIRRLARSQRIPFHLVSKKFLNNITSNANNQSVVAVVPEQKYVGVDDLVQNAKEKNKSPFILILHEFQDPHNLGAVLRTADACGVDGVIIGKHRCVGITPAVIKVSAGAAEHISVVQVANISYTIEHFQKDGFKVFAADAKGEKNYYDVDLKGPIVLVLGSEEKGLTQHIKEKCDCLVKIPIVGRVSSLNVSVAAGILMYEAHRQRNLIPVPI